MTPKQKRIYMLVMFIIFLVLIPVLVLYSSGYRLNSRFRLVKTGGIYFHNNESGVAARLNGKVKKTSGLLEKNLLIRDLRPATYYSRIEKEGYRVWEKNITVNEQMVEVCYPLLIPDSLKPEPVTKYLKVKPVMNGRKPKYELNEEYVEAAELFKVYGKPVKGMLTVWENSDIRKLKLSRERRLWKKVFLFQEGNKIYVRWTGGDEERPYFIPSKGKRLVYAPEQKILSFGFFPERNDSMLVLLDDGSLFAVEIDTRFDIQNTYRIAKNCSRFAVNDELLYYYSEGVLYRIDFER